MSATSSAPCAEGDRAAAIADAAALLKVPANLRGAKWDPKSAVGFTGDCSDLSGLRLTLATGKKVHGYGLVFLHRGRPVQSAYPTPVDGLGIPRAISSTTIEVARLPGGDTCRKDCAPIVQRWTWRGDAAVPVAVDDPSAAASPPARPSSAPGRSTRSAAPSSSSGARPGTTVVSTPDGFTCAVSADEITCAGSYTDGHRTASFTLADQQVRWCSDGCTDPGSSGASSPRISTEYGRLYNIAQGWQVIVTRNGIGFTASGSARSGSVTFASDGVSVGKR